MAWIWMQVLKTQIQGNLWKNVICWEKDKVFSNRCVTLLLGFVASSESGKSVTGDESSLGILQLDGLPG